MNKKLLKYFNGDDLAANVWQGKYQKEGEETPDDMHHRMAKEFARIEYDYILEEREKFNNLDNKEFQLEVNKLSDYGEDLLLLNDEELPKEKLLDYLEENIYNLFKDFKYIIPQGSIMSQLGSNTIGSLSNCFVIGQPDDSYGGIFQKDEELAQLMKRRGGVGIDISTLRPDGTKVSNVAKTSTGAVSFMHRFSNTTREVAQGGRRGALMISMDINHPDILEFIKIKRDLTQVTGANISIKLNNEFMKAVENNEDYILRFPCTSSSNIDYPDPKQLEYNSLLKVISDDPEKEKYIKKIKAKEYWDEIIKSAHSVAEPGIMNWDIMLDYSPDSVYPQFKQVTTNPCSEIAMQEYDACRLIAVNLFSFVDNPFTVNAKFNMDKFYKINYKAMRLSDDLIDLEIEHIDRIINKLREDPESNEIKARELVLWLKIRQTAIQSRRTGLGFTALGDTLAALNIDYDSEEALEIIKQIMQVKMRSELDCTTDLAILRGTFEGWNNQLEYPDDKDDITVGSNTFYKFLQIEFPSQYLRMYEYGRRNISWSTVAPTGTVSLLTQTTSGVEPLFQPFYTRRKKVNPNEDIRVDFVDGNGDSWQEFPVIHPKFKDWLYYYIGNAPQGYLIEDVDDIEYFETVQLDTYFKLSPWYNCTANDIDWDKRIEIQSIIQKYISHSISSTINLPNDVSEEEVSNIYMKSWEKGLKGITVYRDGSRSGVLVSNKPTITSFEYKDATKRPSCLPVDIHTITSQGVKWNVIIGLQDNKPYEVFAVPYFTNETSMELCKKGKGKYNLIKYGETYSEDITSEMNAEQEIITRLISTSLRHRTDIKFIVEQLGKTHGDMFSFAKVITRVLKKYIPEGAKSTITCNECGSNNVIFEEGCSRCRSCGNSKCG